MIYLKILVFSSSNQVKFAVSRCWSALQYASLALRNDKAIVMDALAQSGDALKFASDELKADREVVLVVCSLIDELVLVSFSSFACVFSVLPTVY